MAMSDPLGDMLTRIRNGQMANKGAVKAPASKLRAQRARGAAARGLHPRLRDGRRRRRQEPSSSIELKYHNGEPVIRELRRVSKPGRRIYAGRRASCRASTTASASPSSRRRAGSCPTPRRARRGSAAKSCARCSDHVANRQASRRRAGWRHRRRSRARRSRPRASSASWPSTLPPEVDDRARGRQGRGHAARRGEAGAGDVGHVPLAGAEPGQGRVRGLHAASSRSPASATVPPSTARS